MSILWVGAKFLSNKFFYPLERIQENSGDIWANRPTALYCVVINYNQIF